MMLGGDVALLVAFVDTYYECMNYEVEVKLYVGTPISKLVVVNGTVVDVGR